MQFLNLSCLHFNFVIRGIKNPVAICRGIHNHSLIEALKSRESQTRLSDAFNNLKQNVEQEVRFDRLATQSPIMVSRWNGESPSEPSTVLSEIRVGSPQK